MTLGCCVQRNRVITIKGIDTATGITIWEYGPGFHWRHHYGIDSISGLEPEQGVTLNKYVVAASAGGIDNLIEDRNAATLTANAAECVSLTTLDAIDGTVSSQVTLDGLFCSSVGPVFAGNVNWTASTAAALSGGGYVIVGQRWPAIELLSFTSNTTNKSYVLHAHGQQEGTVTFKTRTSNESITVAWDASASTIATAFAATSDCVSATGSGGPWPYRKITIDAVWSVASGDIKSISRPSTYVSGVDFVTRTVNCCAHHYDTAGLMVSAVGHTFGEYTARLINTSGILPSPFGSSAILHIGSGPSDTVVLFATKTGDSGSYESWNVGSTWSVNWSRTNNSGVGSPPAFQQRLQVESDALIVANCRKSFASPTRNVSAITTDVAGGTRTEYDQTAFSTTTANNEFWLGACAMDGDATKLMWFNDERYATHTDYPTLLFTLTTLAEEVYAESDVLLLGWGQLYGFNADTVFGYAGIQTPRINGYPPPATPSPSAGSVSYEYPWTFYLQPNQRFETGTEFRFVFDSRGPTPKYSNWLDWLATASQIGTAILAGIGENTEGVKSSVNVTPFGDPVNNTNNTNVSFLELGLQIIFLGSRTAEATALGFLPGSSYYANGKVTVETRTRTQAITESGITAWSRTDASVTWSRPFGDTVAGSPVPSPSYAWLKGDFLYAAGGPVDNEL